MHNVDKLISQALEMELDVAEREYGCEFGSVLRYALTSSNGQCGGSLSRGRLSLLLSDNDSKASVALATGIEMLHHASLCVDDIIDEGSSRREKASVWRHFSTETALLASHLLVSRAYELIGGSLSNAPYKSFYYYIQRMIVAEASVRNCGPETLEKYIAIVRAKTGGLYVVSGLSLHLNSSQLGECDISAVLSALENIGVARQIRDDLMDASPDASGLFINKQAHDHELERTFGRNRALLARKEELLEIQLSFTERAITDITTHLAAHSRLSDIVDLCRNIAIGAGDPVAGLQ